MFLRTMELDSDGDRARRQGATHRQQARYGRFLQPDPLGYDDGMNPYAYVGGDPVNWTDPDGLAKNEIIITWRPKPQNPNEGARIGTFGTPSPGGGGNREKGEDDTASCMADPEHCAIVDGKPPAPPPPIQLAQLEIDMRTPLQRMDDQLGITQAVRRGAEYLRNCRSGVPKVDPERAAVGASRGAIRGSVVGAGRGAVLGSPMGPPGSGWGATGGAVTGTLSGAVTGAARSIIAQACEAGNP